MELMKSLDEKNKIINDNEEKIFNITNECKNQDTKHDDIIKQHENIMLCINDAINNNLSEIHGFELKT